MCSKFDWCWSVSSARMSRMRTGFQRLFNVACFCQRQHWSVLRFHGVGMHFQLRCITLWHCKSKINHTESEKTYLFYSFDVVNMSPRDLITWSTSPERVLQLREYFKDWCNKWSRNKGPKYSHCIVYSRILYSRQQPGTLVDGQHWYILYIYIVFQHSIIQTDHRSDQLFDKSIKYSGQTLPCLRQHLRLL